MYTVIPYLFKGVMHCDSTLGEIYKIDDKDWLMVKKNDCVSVWALYIFGRNDRGA